MKKILFLLITIISICPVCFGYSKSFEYLTSVMSIEYQTEQGYKLNEDIYNAYQQFVYGSPLMVTSTQRWKNVSNGKWTKNGGIWQGSGIRGEYWVLGYNFSDEYVHNHQFPVDIEPPTPPTQWRYVELSDAIASWSNTQLYIHEEQKEYMQNTRLMRNNITYDLTANDIGLSKTRVENYATWKTNGNIYTRRYDMNNKEWAANFIVPPMAADASIKSRLSLVDDESYVISKDEDSISIPVSYGADAINLTSYAKSEHVKRIYSEIVIADRTISSVEKEKDISVSGETMLVINKNDYPNKAVIEIEVNCNSMLITEFTVDGALVDTETRTIKVKVEGITEEDNDISVKRENRNFEMNAIPPHIDDIKLGRQEKSKIVPLNIARKTNSSFICAGQVLAIEVEASNTSYITLEFSGDRSIITLDELTKKFEWDEPRSRNLYTRKSTLKELKETYKEKTVIRPYKTRDEKTYFKYYYVIPYMTKQTLHSWSSLREISRDAFFIYETQLFSRISNPYKVVIKAHSSEGIRTKDMSLDVFERWDTLYNRDLTPYIK